MQRLGVLAGVGGLLLAGGSAFGQHVVEFGAVAPGGPGTVADATPSCPWDCGLPQDKIVDTIDFLALLAQWAQIGTSCDFDNNGVDTVDFLKLLAAWGPCPAPPNDECDGKFIIDRVLPDETLVFDFDMGGATPSPEIPQCEDIFAKDIWYCLEHNGSEPKGVTISTSLPLTIEVTAGCTCPPGPLVVCGINGQAAQFPMNPGDRVKIRLINSNGLPNDQLKGQMIIENKSLVDPVNFFLVEADFLDAMTQAGKTQKLLWNFKPHVLPDGAVVNLDDGLNINTHGLEPDDPWTDTDGTDLWPPDVDNVTFSSNLNPQSTLVPLGPNGLAFASTGFGGLNNNALISNSSAAALDIVSGPPAGDNHTAFSLELVKPSNDGLDTQWRITVFDKQDLILGSTVVDISPFEKVFLGIQAKETTIGRIDIYDVNDSFEGISAISAWQLPPGEVNLFTDPAAFDAALQQSNKTGKFFWDFKPDNTVPGAGCQPIQDPLDITTHPANAPGIWSNPFVWPLDVDNVQFWSSFNPQGPLQQAAGLIYCKGPNPEFQLDNNGLVAEFVIGADTSFSIVSGPPAGDNHTAMSFELVSAGSFGGAIARYHITVFDKQDLEIGKFVLVGGLQEKVFAGLITKDPLTTIGRIDIWDEFGGQEGVSSIAAWINDSVTPPDGEVEPCVPPNCPDPADPEWCLYQVTSIQDPLQECTQFKLMVGQTICVARCPFPSDPAPCRPNDPSPDVTFAVVGTQCRFTCTSLNGCQPCPPGAPAFNRIN